MQITLDIDKALVHKALELTNLATHKELIKRLLAEDPRPARSLELKGVKAEYRIKSPVPYKPPMFTAYKLAIRIGN
jgi:hypothetical protein